VLEAQQRRCNALNGGRISGDHSPRVAFRLAPEPTPSEGVLPTSASSRAGAVLVPAEPRPCVAMLGPRGSSSQENQFQARLDRRRRPITALGCLNRADAGRFPLCFAVCTAAALPSRCSTSSPFSLRLRIAAVPTPSAIPAVGFCLRYGYAILTHGYLMSAVNSAEFFPVHA
jgi:hypothetical protein